MYHLHWKKKRKGSKCQKIFRFDGRNILELYEG